jgi:carboxyl-terminal processing protease
MKQRQSTRFFLGMGLWCGVLLLNACGGSTNKKDSYQAGVYKDSNSFKNLCESPRSGASRITGVPFPDRKGKSLDEKNWLRSWSHETYLWYNELPDINPNNGDSPQVYFDRLVTSALINNQPKDRFHFYVNTEEFEAQLTQGSSYGYGAEWIFVRNRPPRDLRIAFVEAGSPAAAAGLKRGTQILAVDGVDLVNDETENGVNTLNNGVFPATDGEVHVFRVIDVGTTDSYEVTLRSDEIVASPIHTYKSISTNTGKVGYIVFNTHIETAEAQFNNAVNALKAENITDLVLDLRYNGGGLLLIAAEIGYMIAGTKSIDKTFERLIYNNKIMPAFPDKFERFANFGLKPLELPTFNLNKVYILSGSGTCSASESIINGLRGIDVEVILIGEQTCGKPYGFYPEDNCGTTYSTIQFSGVNAKNYGSFVDGFIPSAVDNQQDRVKGCAMADDLTNELGSESEKLLAAALNYRATGSCPSVMTKPVAREAQFKPSADGIEFKPKESFSNNKILTR